MAMGKNDELESLRHQVRDITAQIMRNVHQRMELAKRIGDIKSRLGIDVKDEKVENEIRTMVLSLADEMGMGRDFALQLLNILLAESEQVQAQNRKQKGPKQTHLGIFMKAKQLEASGKKIIHMEVGEPDYSPPAAVGDSLAESFKLRQYHYTDTRGIPKLREAIARKEYVSEDQVVVTPGGRFAVFGAITSLLNPGQELIVIEPAWPAYKECADFIGARTKVLRTTLESKWTPDLKQLEEMVNPSTKMIALNYPNNPTGKVLDSKTMEKIVSIAKDNGLYLMSDEVYADYAFKKFTSINEYGYDRSILVSSFSKRYAMTGFRVGYAVAEKDIITKIAKVQAVGITSVAEPVQHAALAALGEDATENVKTMKKRLDFVCRKLKELSLRFVEPDGAMYVYPEIPRGDDISLVERLLEKGVAIAPGSGFGDYYRQFVRISACQPEKTLERGLDVMASAIRESA
ncbi:MAG TPA: aminotransferase class I/II-fold pyridoxal phosphate-dependent enzyme [Nitrososphaera sp.]|nr:aminotransferase class I/II-fold pyridoxal phosphate-dependent enzyme [Nitrososphaera sp.]